MRKLIALTLCVLLLVSMSVTAFASGTGLGSDEFTSSGGNANNPFAGNVNVKITDSTGKELDDDDIKKVYYVEITWDKLNFTFQADQNVADLTWDAENHVYTNMTGAWGEDAADNNDGSDVVVKNHSNAQVTISAAFSNDTQISDVKNNVTATISNGNTTLASAVGTTTANAPSTTYTASVSGTPNSLDTFTVDVITVTISK